ncbi:hypothetical protein [Tistrella sp.]|nr:hypothetical protein [Tistrella sp.]|tara:strand:+ start:746 stop:871 length:126 start_codon:yes stop_codon:yes gene_type:complete
MRDDSGQRPLAAQARNLGLTVITANAEEFSRVPDLPIETWL